jgi:L-cysteine desulfidase
MDKNALLKLLASEMERSTGCTDPGAVALAVALAARELGAKPDMIEVLVSPNVYKNGISVGIPGTGERGLAIAAALGAVIGHPEAGLAIFDSMTPAFLEEARQLVREGRVMIRFGEAPDPLYIRAELSSGGNGPSAPSAEGRSDGMRSDIGHSASAVIMNDYSGIVEVARDGLVVFSSQAAKASAVHDAIAGNSLESLFALVDGMDEAELEFLLSAVAANLDAARVGLASPALKLGASLSRRKAPESQPFAAMHAAQVWTAAASEARMSGLAVPIMAITGSGNHGITLTLGLLAAAETLGSPRLLLAKALARGAAVTIMIKSQVHRMTAFCGCAVAASTGVAAGTVYLLGGDYAAAERAMQTVIGTLAGMLCDGAKESCAYKLSTSASLAIQSAFGAIEGASIPPGMGIVGATAEESFANLGELNNPGMIATDALVLKLIGKNNRALG